MPIVLTLTAVNPAYLPVKPTYLPVKYAYNFAHLCRFVEHLSKKYSNSTK